jgi:hypothetical protein
LAERAGFARENAHLRELDRSLPAPKQRRGALQ